MERKFKGRVSLIWGHFFHISTSSKLQKQELFVFFRGRSKGSVGLSTQHHRVRKGRAETSTQVWLLQSSVFPPPSHPTSLWAGLSTAMHVSITWQFLKVPMPRPCLWGWPSVFVKGPRSESLSTTSGVNILQAIGIFHGRL